MSEEIARENLVNALKARALFYYAFYKEFSAEIGPEKTREIIKRAVCKRGLEIGKQFAKFGPWDTAGLKDAFLAFIPEPTTMEPSLHQPRTNDCAAERSREELHCAFPY